MNEGGAPSGDLHSFDLKAFWIALSRIAIASAACPCWA